MRTEIEINGEIIELRTEIQKEETGVIIRRDNLEDTMDFSKELEALKNESSTD